MAGIISSWLLASAAPAQTINREILGLYDSADETRPDQTRLHRLLEMPLNHLGYKLTLHDVATGLPEPAAARRFHAVATWFSDRIGNADAYFPWAAGLAATGVRFVVIDSVGALGGKDEIAAINGFLAHLGLAYAPYYVGDSVATRLRTVDRDMIDFEHKLTTLPLPGHQVVVARTAKVRAHLSVTDPAHRWVAAPASTLVATGPRGGFIASGFAIHYDKETQRVRWIVDPIRFLQAALGGGRWPIPDTTTVSGRRIYFSHIDGDGWNNVSEVDLPAQKPVTSARIMLERLITPYPDLPVSVGLIAGDVDASVGGDPAAAEFAKAMYAMPQVEVASHTHTHPYFWKVYEDYKRDREVADVKGFVGRETSYYDRSLTALVNHWNSKAATTVAAATPTSAEPARLPRARPHLPFDLTKEVAGALQSSTLLAPAGKTAKLYLWSGDTRPFEAAVRATREIGVRNMNGGDSRYDAKYPSMAYVPPLSRMVGAERQIYAVNSNENTYTNGWSGPFDAFATLSETLDNTELPRRLKGFNLYYHTFSASKQQSLSAVVGHLERARAAAVVPIEASRYAAIADGYFSAEIAETGPRRWRIDNRGELASVRFENADDIEIDYPASVGVIGHNRHAGALYASLDSAVAVPVVAVQPVGRGAPKPRLPVPHLVESRWTLSSVTRGSCEIGAVARGYGAGDMVWDGLLPGTYSLTATRDGVTLYERQIASDAHGRLAARVEADAILPLQVRLACDAVEQKRPAVAVAPPRAGRSAKPNRSRGRLSRNAAATSVAEPLRP